MKKLLRLTVFMVALCLLANISTKEAYAESEIKINALGKNVSTDVKPFVLNGRTMVPIRFVSEALGAKVNWNDQYRTITIEKPYQKQLYIDLESKMQNSMGATIYAQGGYYGASSYSVYLDVAPVVKNGRTFLPARIIAEELGYYVNWDASTRTVNITKNYVGGQTYKEYLQEQNKDPYDWSPYLKEQFEAEMLARGYVDSKDQLIYKKGGIKNGEGYYNVKLIFNGNEVSLVAVNVKTGWFHG